VVNFTCWLRLVKFLLIICVWKKRITKAWLHFISPCYISCLLNTMFPLLFGFIAFFSKPGILLYFDLYETMNIYYILSFYSKYNFTLVLFCCFPLFLFFFFFIFVSFCILFILWILLCYLRFSVHLTVTFP
jgi:hypothetical protein